MKLFPKDMEYVHPLDVKREVYTVLPVTVLPMLSFKLSLVTLKVAGASRRVQLPLDALDGLAFVMISSANQGRWYMGRALLDEITKRLSGSLSCPFLPFRSTNLMATRRSLVALKQPSP